MSGTEVPSGFKSLPDQEHPAGILAAILEKGNIPHAFLFTGISGVGKHAAAVTFAMALNCEAFPESPKAGPEEAASLFQAGKVPCIQCGTCRRIASGLHPDIISIAPSGDLIKIAPVRELCRRLRVKPHEANDRVILIRDAHAMNKEAANALLKVLEEPPERTIFILTASGNTDLLPTIVSRCLHIRFNPISLAALTACLTHEHGIEEEDALALGAMAEGSITRALSMYRKGWLGRRKWLTRVAGELPRMSLGARLAFAEKLAAKKELLPDSLEIIKNYLRDILIFPSSPNRIINKDLEDGIGERAGACPADSTISKIDAVVSAQQDLARNANPRLTLEVLVMRLSRA